MAISQKRLADMMAADPGGAAASPAAPVPTPDNTAGPMTAPMSTPEPKQGTKEAAMVNLSMALDLIEQSLPALGSESPEGQKAMAAQRSLAGLLGPQKARTGELQPAEIMQLLGSLPQAGNMPPEAAAILGGKLAGAPGGFTPQGGTASPITPPNVPMAQGGPAPMPGGMPGPTPGM
jgi:hypothetical protein